MFNKNPKAGIRWPIWLVERAGCTGPEVRAKSIILAGLIILIINLAYPTRLTFAFYLENNQSADVVIGQPDFASNSANQGGDVAANTLSGPHWGLFHDGSRLFIVDGDNNRVLIFNSIPTENNASADVVIGQPDFTSNSANQGGDPAANTLSGPGGIFSDGLRLFIAESSNHRVLIFNSIPTSNNASADVVIGQPDFTSNSANQGALPGANTLSGPRHAYSDGTKLFITDFNNHRALIFNSIPTENNASADVVIGQADFVSGSKNQGGSGGPNTLQDPYYMITVDGKLIVSDANNQRVLIFNSIPTENNASADVVIGQTDFYTYTNALTVSATSLGYPIGLYSDGTRLFIAQRGNSYNRVSVFNSLPTSNMAPADIVIGQPDFSSGSANQGGTPAANTLNVPRGVASDGTKLFIADNQNHRVLIYSNLRPLASTIGTATVVSSSSIRWGFVDNSGVETGFRVYDSSDTLVSTDARSNLSYVEESGLTANTEYSGRYVKAYNSYGESQDSEAAESLYTLAPTPSGLTTSRPEYNSMRITLNSFPNDTVSSSGYYFYRQGDEASHNSGWIQTNSWQDTTFKCNTHYTWRVKYRNAEGVETEEVSVTSSDYPQPCGGGLPAVAYSPPSSPAPTPENPEGGFRILINNGAESADDRAVNLKLFAGPDTRRMVISNNDPEFKDAGQQDYQNEIKDWDLCSKYSGLVRATDCPEGEYTVYAKFYTQWGQASETVSAKILLEKAKNGSEHRVEVASEPAAAAEKAGRPSLEENADMQNAQAKISEIKQRIVQLLVQLIGMIQEKINQLRAQIP